ncbi:MAG: VWA domain-containing protein [Thermoanaerobaculia bacterium]|nr:VWA domain-containing protein [Thermoanaerobaculia bacterium]MCZ7651383.1 VWA domain-containing protein [Thermoanaerobaculia bacterium]
MSQFPVFASPLWLFGLAALPLLAWWHHHRPRHGALLVSRLPSAPAGRWRLHLPFYLKLGALAALLLALARPQAGYSWEESLTEGIDIQLVLDISGSMGAEDFQPENRLGVAKGVLRDFVSRRPADRLGLTVFGGTAMTRAPLTTDRRLLDELIAAVELNEVADGTAIGVALASAARRLEAGGAKSRVAVLVTDGVNNAGEIDPRSATALCAGLGIRVYTIGVGTSGRVPVPVPVRDPITGRTTVRRAMMDVEVDEPLLREVAERTGGAYFQAADPRALAGVFAEIDRLEKTPLKVKRYVRYEERFAPFAWAALALLTLAPALAAIRVTVEP